MFAHETARETVVLHLINTDIHVSEHVHYNIWFIVLRILVKFYVPFKIISAHQSVGGVKTWAP